ncbi:MAG TPA: hypothetical protein DIW77_18900 [Chromatiaceae bacterium]|nr:hypothetical protein [Chromatiaceae bacterium]
MPVTDPAAMLRTVSVPSADEGESRLRTATPHSPPHDRTRRTLHRVPYQGKHGLRRLFPIPTLETGLVFRIPFASLHISRPERQPTLR